MSRLKRIIVALLFMPALWAQAETSLPTQGSVTEANHFSAGSYTGKVVYLDFWASWCGPCRQSFPFMQALQERYEDDGLAIVAVNLDSEQDLAREFLAEFQPNFDVIFDPDGSVAKRYGVVGMPSSFVLNRKGEVVASHTGFLAKDKPEITQLITDALSQ